MTGSAAEGRVERDRILSEVEIAHRAALDRGMALLTERAKTGTPFSANDVRDQLREVGVQAASTGALFNAAIKAGLLKRIGWVSSTDVGTHSKPVMTYLGNNAAPQANRPRDEITVPVQRDRDGRFTTAPPAAVDVDTPLFDFMAKEAVNG